MTDEELARELWFLLPVVELIRDACCCCWKGKNKGEGVGEGMEMGEYRNEGGQRRTEVEMATFQNSSVVKHNFRESDSSVLGAVLRDHVRGTDESSTDTDTKDQDDLESGKSATLSPLHASDLVENFVSATAAHDSNASTSTSVSAINLFKVLELFGTGDSALDRSVWEQLSNLDTDTINLKDTSPSGDGDTLVLLACRHKISRLLPTLIRKGADLNALTKDGATCLHLVCAAPASEVMTKALLEANADPNVQEKETGATPLHLAVTSNDLGLCR